MPNRPRGPTTATTTALAAVLLLGAGCTGNAAEPDPPTATLETATPTPSPTPTPQATPQDPYAIPDHIDTAYLDRVFEALNAISWEVIEELRRERHYTARADALLSATLTGQALEAERVLRSQDVEEDPSLPEYGHGPMVSRPQRIVLVDEGCVAAEVIQDRNAFLANPNSNTIIFAVLITKEPGTDFGDYNPTPWQLAARIPEDQVGPEDEAVLCEHVQS